MYACNCSNCKQVKVGINTMSCPSFGKASKQKQVALKTGDRVLVDGQWPGFVRYIGDLDGSYISSDHFIGIKLDDPVGEHDGILDGKRYFKCPDKHGVIVPRKRVILVLSREAKHAARKGAKGNSKEYSLPSLSNVPAPPPLKRVPLRPTTKKDGKIVVPQPPFTPIKEVTRSPISHRITRASKPSLAPIPTSYLSCPPEHLLCPDCTAARNCQSGMSSHAMLSASEVQSVESLTAAGNPSLYRSKKSSQQSATGSSFHSWTSTPLSPASHQLLGAESFNSVCVCPPSVNSTTSQMGSPSSSTFALSPMPSFTGRLLSAMPPEEQVTPVSANTHLADIERFEQWVDAWGGGPNAWTMATTLQKLKDAQRRGAKEVEWQKTIESLEKCEEYQPQIR